MFEQAKTRVLYLEDDEDARTMVTFMLAGSNIEVIVAKTTEEALQLAKTQKFDLYLLDGLIPGGNSLDLCRTLHKYAPRMPILFYSALAFQSDIQNGMDAGANGYLVKPFIEDLSERVLETVRHLKSVTGDFDGVMLGDYEEVRIRELQTH